MALPNDENLKTEIPPTGSERFAQSAKTVTFLKDVVYRSHPNPKKNIREAAENAVEEIYEKISQAEFIVHQTILDKHLSNARTQMTTLFDQKASAESQTLFKNYYVSAVITPLAELLAKREADRKIEVQEILQQANRMLRDQFLYRAYNECEHIISKYCQNEDDIIKNLLTAKYEEIEIAKTPAILLNEKSLNFSIAELNTKIIEYGIRIQYAKKNGKQDSHANIKLTEATQLLTYAKKLKKIVQGKSLICERLPTVTHTFGGTLPVIRADVKAIRDKLQKECKEKRARELSAVKTELKEALKNQNANILFSDQLLVKKLSKLYAELKMREIKYAIRVSKGQEHRGFGKKTTIKSASEKLFATTRMIKEVERLIENLSGNNIPPIEEWNTASAEEGTLKKYYDELQKLSTEVNEYPKKYLSTQPDQTERAAQQDAVSLSQALISGLFAQPKSDTSQHSSDLEQKKQMQLIVHPSANNIESMQLIPYPGKY